MKILIKKIQANTFLAILMALLLGFVVIFLSKYLSKITLPIFEDNFSLNFYTKNIVFKFYMLVLSVLFILLINNGSIKSYGFQKPQNIKYLKMIFVTIGITVGAFIFGMILFMGILSHIFPPENTKGLPEPSSLIEMILTVWIWSSICEEVLVRGLMQSFIQNLKSKKFLKLSLPVWISGLFFGAMHISLFFAGKGHWFVSFIVFNTTVIGLLTAYYREKTDSIISPIIIHFLANFVGSIPLIIKILIS